ncbi:MAG TPA: MBL fold metallo-hydrolase [Candidatus Dormibacteraeota bacterium]|jgi:glyoxylase-like metal-dependent hydrolase (beta-lactamase superfamily II)|nr:MBL fold metallo-hydrolase [Candidatus Dormibacteraeota bacterium]
MHLGHVSDNAEIVTTELALTEVAADIFELRLPIPFEDGLVNVFLFPDGDEADLVDCGMNTEESVGAIHAAVRHVGARRIRRLVVTHIHPDHYGAAGAFAGEGLADLYLHRLEVPLVYPRYVDIEHLVSEVRTYLLVNGVPEGEAEVMSNSQRALSEIVKPAVPAVQLDGAETLDVGRRRLRVEWTPGHSPGHICLFDESDKVLLAGDHILPELSPNIGLHPQSTPDPLHEYLEGLKRLAAYEPSLILPAHGRPFRDAATRVKALLAHHKKRLTQLAAIVSGGERSAWSVALEQWGPRDNSWEKRAALQEGLAHLQALAVEGRVKKLVTPTAVRWSPT